jgi:hypothetical protein
MAKLSVPEKRSFVQLREELTEALTAITLNSGLLYEDCLKDQRRFERAKYVFEASLIASAVFKVMFQGEGEGGFSIRDLRKAFSLTVKGRHYLDS